MNASADAVGFGVLSSIASPAWRLSRWTLAVLLGAALGGAPAGAAVSFDRTDVALPGAPDSVALGDLDGVHGKDIVVALAGARQRRRDAQPRRRDVRARCSSTPPGRNAPGLAVDITLGDVTAGGQLRARRQARRLRRLHAERRAADGRRRGRAGQPGAVQPEPPAVPRLRDARHARADAAPGRQSRPAARLPARGRKLRPRAVHQLRARSARNSCAVTTRRCRGRWPSAISTGALPACRPTRSSPPAGADTMGIFGFAPVLPLDWSAAARGPCRTASSRPRSATSTTTATSTCSWASRQQPGARVDSIHYFRLGRRRGLEQVATTAAVDAGPRRRGGRRRRRRRLQRRRRRRRLRERDGPPRRRRGRLRRRPGPAAARLPEPGDGHPRDHGRGRPVRGRPAGARHRRHTSPTP